MAKRLNEFCTSSRIVCDHLYLYAWAIYKRGDIPDTGEFEYINKRVTDKYPEAELVQMQRSPVPTWDVTTPYTNVRWGFEWIVYNYKKESEVSNDKNN